MDEIIRAVRDCPSGALSYAIDRVEARQQVDWDNGREPAIDAAHRRQEGPQGDRRRRQDGRAQGISGVASGDRPHRRQEDHPQEFGLADEIAPRAFDQGAGIAAVSSFPDEGRLRAPFSFSDLAGIVGMAIALVLSNQQPPSTPRRRTPPFMRPTTPLRPPQPTDAQPRRRHRIAFFAAAFALLSAMPGPATGAADAESARRATEIEAYLPAHPRRALIEIPPLLAAADTAPATQRQLLAMQGQAFVLSGRIVDAQVLSDRLESEARVTSDPRGLATALLVRSAVQSSIGDAGTANAFAHQASALLQGTDDPFLTHWALMAIGTTARARGRREESMGSLHEALALAERVDLPYRRSSALYQLSVLHLDLKQGDRALEMSLEAWKFAEAAGSAYAMVNARMAESAALELLDRPERELASMQEALAIAHKSQSKIAESRALVNLSDIELRRHHYKDALALARRSLDFAVELDDTGLASTSKANMGFALLASAACRRASGSPTTRSRAMSVPARRPRSPACSASTPVSREGGRVRRRPLFHRERKLNDELPSRRTSAPSSSCRKSTSRTSAGARSRSSTATTTSRRRSCGRTCRSSAAGGCSPAVRDLVRRRCRSPPQTAHDEPAPREKNREPRSRAAATADRAL
jgi:tetratricopeptide (TPR) repeat protein